MKSQKKRQRLYSCGEENDDNIGIYYFSVSASFGALLILFLYGESICISNNERHTAVADLDFERQTKSGKANK